MNRAALTALLSHWRRHPFQALTLIVGLALATGLWTGVQAINAQARLSYAEAAETLGQSAGARLVGDLDLADFAAARRAGLRVTPLIEAPLPGGQRLLGLDPFTAPPGEVATALGEAADLAAFLTGALVLTAPGTTLSAELPPARGIKGIEPGLVMADIAAAQAIAGTDGLDALLLLDAGQADALVALFPDARLVVPAAGGDIGRLTDSFHLNLTAFGLLAFAVGLFIVHSAIGLAFEQRRPLLRTLRALGVPTGRLVTLLTVELLALTLVAGALGVGLGYVVAALLLPGVAATLSGLYGAGVSGALALAPEWWLSGLAIALAGAILAGGQSLWQLARLPVLAPAMPRAWARARTRTMRRQGIAGAALLVVAGTLAVLGDGLIAGFVCLGALLLGAAFLLPPILTAILDLGTTRARAGLSQWLWADTRQQVPGLSLALMALLLALAANVGVGTMVGSFRATFTGWLDQRLAAEIYVTARDPVQADEIRAALGPRVDAVLPIVSAEARLEGAPGDIYGVIDHATYRENWPLIDAAPNVWDRLAAGEGALINEQLARRESLWTGDRADLGAGGPREVLGVYSDYGNPVGQAILGLAAFDDAFPDAPVTRFALRLPPVEVRGLMRDLAAEFDLPPEGVQDQAAIKAFSLQVFERTFAVTAALNVLTLGVAGFALWASLATLAGMRLPQVAPVWAMGVTRGHLAAMDIARALLLAGLTAGLAMPVGIALAWVLLAIVNVQAFGWRLPLVPDPAGWARLGSWSFLAAVVAAALPALRLWRMPPAELVKVFAHER